MAQSIDPSNFPYECPEFSEFIKSWQNLKMVLVTNTLPVIVVERTFSLLHAGRYLLPLTTLKGFPHRCSKRNFNFNTGSWNVSIVKYGVSSNHITFEFCFDSLNSMNSLQVNQGKFNYYIQLYIVYPINKSKIRWSILMFRCLLLAVQVDTMFMAW